MYIKFNRNSLVQHIDIISDQIKAYGLNFVQAQNLLIKLECDTAALFDAWNVYYEHGLNKAHIGIAGGFTFGEKED